MKGEGSGGRGDSREKEVEGVSQGENKAENEVMLVRRYRPAIKRIFLCVHTNHNTSPSENEYSTNRNPHTM